MREDLNFQLPLIPPEDAPAPPAPAAEPTAAPQPEPDHAVTDWKTALRRDFERWLDSVDALPACEPAPAAGMPDLFSFYEQLAALGAESRRANRKTAEVFSQWAESLGKFDDELARLRAQLSETESLRDDARLGRDHCLLLIELLDRLQRVRVAFETPPPKPWWPGGDAPWRKAWAAQRQALDIVVDHLESWLGREGVERIETLDEPFDPVEMVAAATEPDAQRPHQTVLEEIVPGYRRDGELLRPAQVKVSIRQETKST